MWTADRVRVRLFRRWFAMGTTGLQLQTAVTRRLLLLNDVSKYLEQTQSSWGKPLTGFELLLTGAFCFQSCGLKFMTILRIFRWN